MMLFSERAFLAVCGDVRAVAPYYASRSLLLAIMYVLDDLA